MLSKTSPYVNCKKEVLSLADQIRAQGKYDVTARAVLDSIINETVFNVRINKKDASTLPLSWGFQIIPSQGNNQHEIKRLREFVNKDRNNENAQSKPEEQIIEQ